MRTGSVGIVDEYDIARLQYAREELACLANLRRQRNDVRGTAFGLAQQLRVGIEQRAGKIQALVDDRGVRGLDHGGPHVTARGNNELLDPLEGDEIDSAGRRVHDNHQLSMRRLPQRSTPASQPGGTTVVLPNSSMIAGPRSAASAPKRSRSYTGQSRCQLPSR